MKMGISTVMAIKRTVPSNLSEVEAVKKRLPWRFYANANEFLNHITPEKLQAASAYQLVGMATLSVQSARDMEGFNRPIVNVIEIATNIQRLTEQSRTRLQQLESKITSTQDE